MTFANDEIDKNLQEYIFKNAYNGNTGISQKAQKFIPIRYCETYKQNCRFLNIILCKSQYDTLKRKSNFIL